MRTKALLLAAAALAAGMITSQAQTVYSANIVGYVNQVLPYNQYQLVTPTLSVTSTNSAEDVFPSLSAGDTLLLWTGTSYASYIYISPGLWQQPDNSSGPAPLLGQGSAVFYLNASGGSSGSGAETNTTVGTVTLTNTVTLPYNQYVLIGSTPPVSDGLDGTNLNLPLVTGDSVLLWDSASASYQPYVFISTGLWQLPNGNSGPAPTLSVGQGFFYLNGSGGPSGNGSAETWTNNITVQ